MLRLLEIISIKNIIHFPIFTLKQSPVEKIKLLLSDIKNDKNEHVIPKILIGNIEAILDTYDIAIREDTTETRVLKNYLITSNDQMKNKIRIFINDSSINSSNKRLLLLILDTITVFEKITGKKTTKPGTKTNKKTNIMIKGVEFDEESDEDEEREKEKEKLKGNKKNISDDTTYNLINFLKSYLQNFLKTFPTIILNKVENGMDDIKIPAYLKIAQNDSRILKESISNYYIKMHKLSHIMSAIY